jgi:hypothetical protein
LKTIARFVLLLAMTAQPFVHGGRRMRREGAVTSRPLLGAMIYLHKNVLQKLHTSLFSSTSRLPQCGPFFHFRY